MHWGRYHQRPVQSHFCRPQHTHPRVLASRLIKYIKCPLAHPALTLTSYLISETLTCVLSSHSSRLIKSDFSKCRRSSLSNLHVARLPTLLLFILVLFSKCDLCECLHSCLSIKILCLPALFTKLFHKILIVWAGCAPALAV